MATSLNIMAFSWNASGLKLCETMSQTKADKNRSGFKGFITARQPCIAPNFFEEIRSLVKSRRPGLVVMSTEDEDKNDTFFHSDLLPKTLTEIGYTLLKQGQLAVGSVPSGIELNNVPTGNPSGSALRISVYAEDNIAKEFTLEEKNLTKFFGKKGQLDATCKQDNRKSGAIATYIWHKTYGKFAFIATHLPSGMNSLNIIKGLNYASYRVATRAANSLCLINLLNILVESLPPESKPDHVFLMGDFNYDIFVPNKKNSDVITELGTNVTAANIKNLQQYDELRKALDDAPLVGFKEGVAGEGPLFMPTWRLTRNRPDSCSPKSNESQVSSSCYDDSQDNMGGVGWHDRILYKDLMTSSYITHCIGYNRLDTANMHASTNAGVLALFEMRNII